MLEEAARLVGWLVPIILLAAIVLPQAVRILREYERGVIFRLGKLYGTKGPGPDFPDSDGGSDGQNGPSGGDDRRRPPRAHDP